MTDYLAKLQDLQGHVRDITAGNTDLKISDKCFAVILVNSLPQAKYGTVVQQLLASIKTLTMSQVTAWLSLEAASMDTDEAQFKEVYASNVFKTKKKRSGKPTEDHCQIHPNRRHSNTESFQQTDKTAAAASSLSQLPLSNTEIVLRYKEFMSPSQSRPERPCDTAKNWSTSKWK